MTAIPGRRAAGTCVARTKLQHRRRDYLNGENRAGEESAAKARNTIGFVKPRKERGGRGKMNLAVNVWMRRSSEGGIGEAKIKGSDGCGDGFGLHD